MHLRGGVHKLLEVLGTTLALTVIGCQDAQDITAPPGPPLSINPGSGQPFYYYEGKPVYLVADPVRATVAVRQGLDGGAIKEILGKTGVAVADISPLVQAARHWLVTFYQGTSEGQIQNAVQSLQADARITFASIAYKTVEGGWDVWLVDRVVVRFKPSVSAGQIEDLVTALGLRIERVPRPDSGFFEYRLGYAESGSTREPLEIAAILSEHALVAWADPDKISNRRRAFVPPDPFYPLQFHLKNSITLGGVPVDINVEPAWDQTKGGGIPSAGGMKVAVIDDGVEAWHEDVYDALMGYDVVLYNNTYGCSDCATSPFGNDSHGTHVAGIINGMHNSNGGAGIAPEAQVVTVRIFRDNSVATDCAIGDGINFAWYWASASVLNNSWGGGAPSNCITNAINSANSQGRDGKGSVVVFAAGNTSRRDIGQIGGVLYPGILSSVLAVGAINRNGALTDYTPEGSELDIVAPSGHYTGLCVGEVVTTDLMSSRGCNDGPNGNQNYTSTFSGTSAAAPQVSAVGALLYSVYPSLTSTQAKDIILSSADPWGSSTQVGRGKLNAGRTVSSPPPSYEEPPPDDCVPEPPALQCPA